MKDAYDINLFYVAAMARNDVVSCHIDNTNVCMTTMLYMFVHYSMFHVDEYFSAAY